MARVTVEDCVLKVPNRFELVLLAAQRAREITSGAPLTLDRDDDKNPVVALREIADETIGLDHLRGSVVRGMQKHVEIDEPEETHELELDPALFGVGVAAPSGALLDEEALYTHVQSHPSFLLGIDAWWTEPFLHGSFRMEYPFLELPNVLGSPHNSAVVPNILVDATRQAAENVKHFLKGEHVQGIVRREDYL